MVGSPGDSQQGQDSILWLTLQPGSGVGEAQEAGYQGPILSTTNHQDQITSQCSLLRRADMEGSGRGRKRRVTHPAISSLGAVNSMDPLGGFTRTGRSQCQLCGITGCAHWAKSPASLTPGTPSAEREQGCRCLTGLE